MKKKEKELICNLLSLAESANGEALLAAASYLLYYGQEGRYPQTKEGKMMAWLDVKHLVQRVKGVLKKLPTEILGKEVEWERVSLGSFTKEQRERLQKYCDETL